MAERQIIKELSAEQAIALLAARPKIPQDLKAAAIAAINQIK